MAVPPVTLRANTDPSFVGVAALTARHAAQIADFEAWAAAGQWSQFHHGHYDWWAYPIMRSSAYGQAYTVYEAEIAQLNADPQFVERHRRGIQLGALAWGWDVHDRRSGRCARAGTSVDPLAGTPVQDGALGAGIRL
ncbi:MAG: hypothetical protein IPO91_04190 [Chloroflexi bacterium]|nr:hypothetical protein [Chloroflexota bacterium]